MEPLLWIMLPVCIAVGSALLSYFLMQSKLEVAVARERESLAEAKAALRSQEQIAAEKLRAAEENARRQALDSFLSEFRVEERRHVRESKTMFLNRKAMVLQERLYFRNIPLSNWVEHEMVIEEGGDIQQLAKACSIFNSNALSDGATSTPARLLS